MLEPELESSRAGDGGLVNALIVEFRCSLCRFEFGGGGG